MRRTDIAHSGNGTACADGGYPPATALSPAGEEDAAAVERIAEATVAVGTALLAGGLILFASTHGPAHGLHRLRAHHLCLLPVSSVSKRPEMERAAIEVICVGLGFLVAPSALRATLSFPLVHLVLAWVSTVVLIGRSPSSSALSRRNPTQDSPAPGFLCSGGAAKSASMGSL